MTKKRVKNRYSNIDIGKTTDREKSNVKMGEHLTHGITFLKETEVISNVVAASSENIYASFSLYPITSLMH